MTQRTRAGGATSAGSAVWLIAMMSRECGAPHALEVAHVILEADRVRALARASFQRIGVQPRVSAVVYDQTHAKR